MKLLKALAAALVLASGTMSAAVSAERQIALGGQSNLVAAGGSTTAPIADVPDVFAGNSFANASIWMNAQAATTPNYQTMVLGTNTTQYPAMVSQYGFWGTEWGVASEHFKVHPTDTLRIVKVARGDTSLLDADDWLTTGTAGNYFFQMRDHLIQTTALGKVTECFIWVQGEKDRTKNVALYEAEFRRFYAALKTATGNDNLRLVWVRLTHRADNTFMASTNNFRAMQTSIAGDPTLNVRLVDADNLAKQDNVHFNNRSTSILGHRAYRACYNQSIASKDAK